MIQKGRCFMYALCFILLMLFPMLMLVVGVRWWIKPPAFKTGKLVFRTAETEKSEEVWLFAHHYCAKLWARFGLILAAIAVALMLLLKAHYQTFFLWLLCGEVAVFCATLFIIDVLVKNLFDENGVRVR